MLQRLGIWQALAIVGIATVIAYVVVAYFILRPPDRDPIAFSDAQIISEIREACFAGFPEEERVGFKIGTDASGAFTIDTGGVREKAGTSDTDAHKQAIECTQEAMSSWMVAQTGSSEVSGVFSSTEPLPLGQIAQQWKNTDFFIDLSLARTAEQSKILNNLRFPRYVGTQASAMSLWCEAMSKCAECRPVGGSSIETARGVEVLLTENSSPERIQMWGQWSNPSDPWEDVDEDGNRYYYICEGE